MLKWSNQISANEKRKAYLDTRHSGDIRHKHLNDSFDLWRFVENVINTQQIMEFGEGYVLVGL